jgi:hypothetical protein
MIPLVPLATAIIQKIIYKKVVEAVVEHGAAALMPKPKLEPRVKLDGYKTYIMLLVAAAGFFFPKLGLTEADAASIVQGVAVVAGLAGAAYGRKVAKPKVVNPK